MKTRFCLPPLLAAVALIITGCGNSATREAMEKARPLEEQKNYQEANAVWLEALQAREKLIRDGVPTPTDEASGKALVQKVQSDPEILKLERAQVMTYLRMERADLASAVYGDILLGTPDDRTPYEAIKDRDPIVRAGAARMLGLRGTTEAIAPLSEAAAKDDDKEARRAAVAALGTIKDPKSVDPLMAALTDSYWFTRQSAAEALGRQGDARAITPLLRAVADEDTEVEAAAEASLLTLAQKVPDSYSEEFSVRLNDPNPKLTLISACCLAILRDSRAVPVLLKFLSSPNPNLRVQALKGLDIVGDPSVIPVIRPLLNDPDGNVRRCAIVALGDLKDAESLSVLNTLVTDTTQPVEIRAAARDSVLRIKGLPVTPNAP